MKAKKKRLLVSSYWISCRVDTDYDEMFGCRQYKMALGYLREKRNERPDLEFELIAIIHA